MCVVAKMTAVLGFIIENKEWLFSGAFFCITGYIAAIIVLIYKWRNRNQQKKEDSITRLTPATKEEIEKYDPLIAKIKDHMKG